MLANDATPDEFFARLMMQYQRAMDEQDDEKATELVHKIFAMAEEDCRNNPSSKLDLRLLAGEFLSRGDWSAAETAYQQILTLPNLEPYSEYKAHADLTNLCRLLSRHADSLKHADSATTAARQADSTALLAMALRLEARCLLDGGRITDARQLIDEAMVAIGEDELYRQLRAVFLTLRADCAIRDEDLIHAEADLQEAYELLQPMADMTMAAGAQFDLSRWWSLAATIRSKCKDWNGAIMAWQQAVRIGKHVVSLGHADNVYTRKAIADALLGLANAFQDAGLPGNAKGAMAERESILKIIANSSK